MVSLLQRVSASANYKKLSIQINSIINERMLMVSIKGVPVIVASGLTIVQNVKRKYKAVLNII